MRLVVFRRLVPKAKYYTVVLNVRLQSAILSVLTFAVEKNVSIEHYLPIMLPGLKWGWEKGEAVCTLFGSSQDFDLDFRPMWVFVRYT